MDNLSTDGEKSSPSIDSNDVHVDVAEDDNSVENLDADFAKFLTGMDRKDLGGLFDGWESSQHRAKRRRHKTGLPVDQRIAVSMSKEEREMLMQSLKKARRGGKVSLSSYVRSHAKSPIDIEQWRLDAIEALKELEHIAESKRMYVTRAHILENEVESEDDPDKKEEYASELRKIEDDLLKLKSVQNAPRTERLVGRLTVVESEMLKWRAQRLSITTSDYLRMVLLGMSPGSQGDAHMSFDARRRFYVSVMEVAHNGWGTPPEMTNTEGYRNSIAEIERLNKVVDELRRKLAQMSPQ